MASLIVFYDANVLYPAELRNFLMHLALMGIFGARWSAKVHESLLANRPDLSRKKLERTRELMDKAAPDALVVGYEHLIPQLELPDPNDRHVLAAAIHCGAGIIVTRNLADFPPDRLADFGIEAQHPDEFILHLFELAPGLVIEAAENHRGSLKNPPRTAEEYIVILESQGLTQTALILREHNRTP
ncbi:MAG TPA: PIN domain-containing protein [Terracidiphilus sp.]|nr:PIN domain-containing protein [Terracidiphilus sp.]